MTTIENLPEVTRADLIGRLKKIEGQARGLQKMFEDGRECTAIIDQVASIKAAVNGLSGEMVGAYAIHCLTNAASFESPERAIEDAVRVLVRASR